MAFSKAPLFQEESQILAKIFKTFSHPARVQIFNMLADENKLCSAQMAENMPIAQSTLTEHLTILRSMDFLEYELQDGIPFYNLTKNQIPMWMLKGLRTEGLNHSH